jgi:hypothetical protein
MKPDANREMSGRQASCELKCMGCGKRVERLTEEAAERLRAWDSVERPAVAASAFECSRCEAVIFEDELVLGQFIPPQLRELIDWPEAPIPLAVEAPAQPERLGLVA